MAGPDNNSDMQTLTQEEREICDAVAKCFPDWCQCKNSGKHTEGEKVGRYDVVETRKVIIRDEQGRKRISMDCFEASSSIDFYSLTGGVLLSIGMIDFAQEYGQGQCLETPACYIDLRDQDENVVLTISTQVQDNQLLPHVRFSPGKGLPDVEIPAKQLKAAI